jgi:hypothetical protein
MKKTVISFLTLSVILLAAQDDQKKYIWPLTIDNGVSSTFQEFRSNHFHAGIDLRTFQTTGFPVLAIAEGAIERIIVSWSGIGRAVFLRHNDGNLSLYGHLEKFRDDIEALVARQQKRSGEKYFGTYDLPEPLPVRQGDVIAFSGETGNGLPHLHLEIRDKLNGSLNPLSYIVSPSVDTYAPVLKGILLRSRGDCLVNNDLGEFYFKLFGNGTLAAPAETLSVTGPFDLVLDALDLSDVQHEVAPYSLEAYLDGQPYYEVVFERLLRDDNNQLGMLYDMAYSFPSSYFFKLFFQEGFDLEKRKVSFAEKISLLTPGAHEIKIVVKDRQHNQAVALIPIQKLPAGEGPALNNKIDLQANEDRVLRDADVSLYINRDDVVVKVKDFPRPATWITLRILQGDREQAFAAKEYGAGVYFRFKPLTRDMRMQLRFILSDGRQPVEELQKNIHVLVLKSQTAQQFSYGDFMADFSAKTVLEPTVLLLEKVRLDADYPMLAGPVSIGPTHFAFLDTVLFKFRIPQDEARPEQLGIFKYQPLGERWSYVKTQNVPEAGYLGSRVLTGGIFALFRDIYPPEIRFRSRRKRYFATPEKLVVRLRDRGKGIDDQTVAVFLNGQKTDCEYDPDWDYVIIDMTNGMRKGKNDLRVQAADFAGNRSEKKFRFRLR